jgi:YHS domain-containing protein
MIDSLPRILGALAVGLAIAIAAPAGEEGAKPADPPAGKKEVKAQETCPVSGKAIDKSIFREHDGKRVYFCCARCPAAFEKDPAKYVKKLEDAGVTLEKVQTACPVMEGNKIDKALFRDYKGQRIYFCCGACPPQFDKDPDKYVKKLVDAGVTPEPAPAPPAEKDKGTKEAPKDSPERTGAACPASGGCGSCCGGCGDH